MIDGFLADGRVDTSLYRFRPVDFSPGLGHGGIAKIVLAVALAFAAIALASLLWLPWRVRRRGGLGRRSSALVRSLYPLVLGLGGWFAAALIVLTASLSVPIDNQLLVALSVGTPIGLGIYWGWVQRRLRLPAEDRRPGGRARRRAARRPARLRRRVKRDRRCHGIVGATAGANLLLLMLDIGRDGTARELASAAPDSRAGRRRAREGSLGGSLARRRVTLARVRRSYAHDAVIELEPGGDERAPGAAITVALCGHWDHEPPCPLSPHHTAARRDGDRVELRMLFAVEPEREELVRERIGEALAGGELAGPDGQTTRWRLVSSAAGSVRPEEADHAGRLMKG